MQSRYGYGGDSTRRGWTRWLAPVAAILVAAGAQLYVILYPRPVDVAPVSPAKAARKQQELVIEGLDIGNFKLVHSGYKNELVEVEFKNGHLAEDTLAEPKVKGKPSGEPAVIIKFYRLDSNQPLEGMSGDNFTPFDQFAPPVLTVGGVRVEPIERPSAGASAPNLIVRSPTKSRVVRFDE